MRYFIQVQEKMPSELPTPTVRYEWRKNHPAREFTKIFAQNRQGFENALSFAKERAEEMAKNSEFEIEVGILAYGKAHCSRCEPPLRWKYGIFENAN